MTYDAILAARGWGREELATATRDFRAAVRFAVFAERLAPVVADLAEVQAMNPAGQDVKAQARIGAAKIAAQREVAVIRSMLFPADEDEV